jgi:hypothetical protein
LVVFAVFRGRGAILVPALAADAEQPLGPEDGVPLAPELCAGGQGGGDDAGKG